MKYCKKCNVTISGARTSCPSCQSELNPSDSPSDDGLFPILTLAKEPTHLLLKIAGFASIIAAIICIFLNTVFFTTVRWSLFAIAVLICTWISLAIGISKHKNLLKYLLYQSIIITAFSVLLDFLIGWHGWSITFVVPITFTAAMASMFVLSKVLHLHTGDYMIYVLLDAIFGIIPVIFILNNLVQTSIPSLICILSSIVSVTALIIFEGQKMYSELKRRFHI